MKDYFEKFKELEEKERKELEAETPLEERIKFEGKQIFLDGKLAFTSPLNDIRIVGILPFKEGASYGTIYAGTGPCCHGHLYRLHGGEGLQLSEIYTVDTNVMDILPVHLTKARFNDGILVAGIGCDGNGVRLFNIDKPTQSIDIYSTEKYQEFMERTGQTIPHLEFDEHKRIILNSRINLNEYLQPHGLDIKETAKRIKRFTRLR